MQRTISSVALTMLATLVAACGDGGGEGLARVGGAAGDPAAAAPGSAESNQTAAAASARCPAGIPEPKSIVTDPNASDVSIAGSHVFYRSLTKVVRVNKDGTGQADVVESPDLIRSFVVGTTLLTVDSPTPPTAELHVYDLDAQGAVASGVLGAKAEGLTITTKSNAGGTWVIGSDAENLYLHADEENAEVIYSLGRTKDGTLTEVLRLTERVMSHPQIDGSSLWYVIDGQRVFRLALDAGAASKTEKGPKEIFGIGYASCGLAVGAGKAFCATGATLEQRDMDGANLKPVLEMEKSKARAAVDSAMFGAGALIVRTEFAPKNDGLGRVLRALKPSATGVEESIVACGRGSLSDVAVDATSIVWLEPGKGLFTVPR